MRKLKKYLLDSLKFFVCALFWLDVEDVELTFLGVLMSLFAPITIILTLILFFIRPDLKEELIDNYIFALESGEFLNEEN